MEYLLITLIAIVFFLFVMIIRQGYLQSVSRRLSHCSHACISYMMQDVYNRAVWQKKEELFININKDIIKYHGKVFELGCGGGGSMQFYRKDCLINLVAIEPNTYCEKYLKMNLKKYENIKLERVIFNSGENMEEIESNSVDLLVGTIVLCSVKNQERVLQEVKRVLKKGGRFYFMEHVIAEPGTWLHWIQCFIDPFWASLFDGCHINRNTSYLLQHANFSKFHFQRFTGSFPIQFMFVRPHIYGWVEK